MPDLSLRIDRKTRRVFLLTKRPRPKPASYRHGVAWIALNDEPLDVNPNTVSDYISTLLLADLFNKDPLTVARAIVRYRRKAGVR